MRGPRSSWVASVCCGVLLFAARAGAEPAALEIEAAPRLRAGEVGVIGVRVRLTGGVMLPLLLTPSVEGQALEVVRGRLLRGDAVVLGPDALRFEVPVVARVAGTALLRIELATFQC